MYKFSTDGGEQVHTFVNSYTQHHIDEDEGIQSTVGQQKLITYADVRHVPHSITSGI